VSPPTIAARRYLFMPCLIAMLAASETAMAQIKILPITTQWQETDEWCWAASGQMLMNLIGADHLPPNVPQCYEANQEFSRSDCCTCPTPSACANPGWPQFSAWGFTSDQTALGAALSWTDVTGQINSGMPFMFSWAWNGGGGHAMVAKGYFNFPGIAPFLPASTLVYVANPWSWQGRCGPGGNASGPFGGDIEWITYSEFVGGPGYDHTHMADIYNIKHQ
jgi:Papain-like cysteine protease AvrRpt2